jgi:uncharacterized glyoxalase superfamily protein PhnB
VTIDRAVPNIRSDRPAETSVEVDDVDAVQARAVERGLEIAYDLRDEKWACDASTDPVSPRWA